MNEKPIDLLNRLISNYQFPIEALEDVNNRLKDNQSDAYVMQQVRYLNNLIDANQVTKKESH